MYARILFVVRGPSGTGKSTIAKHLGGVPDVNWFEADNFFYTDEGYKFDPSKLGQAHKFCKHGVEAAMENLIPIIIVSNTGTRIREISHYLKLAEEKGYRVIVFRTPGPWKVSELSERNVHDVPDENIQAQIERYAEYPNEYEWQDRSIFS